MATSQLRKVIHHLRNTFLRDGDGLPDGQLLEEFLIQGKEDAFQALVRRHGPMVLAVCQRVLQNFHDAEDAFQATFLVLVRKAGSLRGKQTIAPWLYGVAYHTALKARTNTFKRRVKEKQVKAISPQPLDQDLWQELQPLLDQELSRLPDKYRVPVVLCDLEGKTRKEAARYLAWPEGTLSGRLSRARVILAKRLSRHGVTVSGGLLAMLLSQPAAAACVPGPLVATLVESATSLAAGQAMTTAITSAKVVALANGVLKSLLLTKLKIATFFLVAFFGVGLGLVWNQTSAPLPDAKISSALDQENSKTTALAPQQTVHQQKDPKNDTPNYPRPNEPKQINTQEDGQQNQKDDGQQNQQGDGDRGGSVSGRRASE